MLRFVTSIVLAFGTAAPAAPAIAQENIGFYLAVLGPADFTNSNGDRLTDFCAIVQQDRVNYHSFNQRDMSDGEDSVFADRGNRAAIGRDCRISPVWQEMVEGAIAGRQQYIVVQIYGTNDRVDYVIVGGQAG